MLCKKVFKKETTISDENATKTLLFRAAHTSCLDEEWPPPLAGTREPVWD